MKAEELRLGNYITDRDKVVTVESHHFQMFESYYKEDFKPIPLTEEWLFKFGFEKLTRHGLVYNLQSRRKGFSLLPYSYDSDFSFDEGEGLIVIFENDIGCGYN